MRAVDYNLVDHKNVLEQIKDIFSESIQIIVCGIWHPNDRAKFKNRAHICAVKCPSYSNIVKFISSFFDKAQKTINYLLTYVARQPISG
jgi:hypothetical protein